MRAEGRALVLVLAAVLAAGCTEDALTGPTPEGQEGVPETVELTIPAGEMATWRDTTFTGFALPSDAPFLLLADRPEFRARSLIRYGGLPDSVRLDGDTLAVEAFVSGEIRVTVDTTASRRPDQGGITLRVFALARPFVASEASWTMAAAGAPWSTQGGDLGRELGSLEVPQLTDSIFASTFEIPLTTDTRAVLEGWRERDGQPGAALVVEGSGARLRLTGAVLAVEAKPVGRDTTVQSLVTPLVEGGPRTFIHDPPLPEPGAALRVGGLPASRAYLVFEPPRQVEGVQLTRSTVNRAELVFPPAAPPPSPFRPDRDLTATAVRLGTNPFRTGAKTPIGNALGRFRMDPDSLLAGTPVRVRVDSLLAPWASNPDSAGLLRAGLRLVPDAQLLGFWEFGSVAAPPERRPFLRLIVTPPSDFEVP